MTTSSAQAQPSSFLTVTPTFPLLSRSVLIATLVALLHVGFIWALYSGLAMRVVSLVVPVAVLSELIEPPKPLPDTPLPSPPPPKQTPPPVKKAITPTPLPAPIAAPVIPPLVAPLIAPVPLAVADPTPAPNAPLGSALPQPAPPPLTAPQSAAPSPSPVPAPAAPTAAAKVVLPSSNADYLQNPRPAYPPMSRRLNEQGVSTIRVLIGADGSPQRAEISKSSGFDRLDQAALSTVLRWKFVPGKRGGVAETMWFDVPINWVLE